MNPQISSEPSKFIKFPMHEEIKISSLYDSSEKENLLSKKEAIQIQPSAYKNKKSLKLVTNSNNLNEDLEKTKLFTPQPQNTILDVNLFFLNSMNCMSHPPSRKLKPKNSQELHDFFYQDEGYEVVLKRCGRKTQEDRVNFNFFLCN